MKKTFNIFIIIFFLSFAVFPSFSFAIVTLTTPDLYPDGVTLKATELEPNKGVTFTLRNNINYSTTPSYFKTKDEISDSTGTTSAGFLELSPGGQYVATINYVGENLTLFTLPFSTPATGLDMTVIMKDLTQTSVAFVLAGFPHNKEISFNVENYDSSTPSYSDPQDYMTDDSGTALFQFYGLSPGGHYKYTHSEASGAGSFWTSGEPIPNPNPNPNPTKTGTPGVLVPCSNNCGFKDLLDMVNTVINFILVFMAVPIAAIMFAYAGFMLVFSGGEPAKRTKAKDIFINVAIGLIFIAACWLIVHTILSIVGFDGSWIGL